MAQSIILGEPEFEPRDCNLQMKFRVIFTSFNVITVWGIGEKRPQTASKKFVVLSFVAEQRNAKAGCTDSHLFMSCGN
jgi:hypothetical protein